MRPVLKSTFLEGLSTFLVKYKIQTFLQSDRFVEMLNWDMETCWLGFGLVSAARNVLILPA